MLKINFIFQRIGIRLVLLQQLARGRFYGFFMKEVGNDFQVGKNVYFSGMNNIHIGNRIHIHNNCYLLGTGGIIIEDHVLFSPGVKIYTAAHNYTDNKKDIIDQGSSYEAVKIKKGSWLCADSIILPGVTVGKHSVVAAGSVVIKDVDDYCVVAGIPAKVIKRIQKHE